MVGVGPGLLGLVEPEEGAGHGVLGAQRLGVVDAEVLASLGEHLEPEGQGTPVVPRASWRLAAASMVLIVFHESGP